MASADFSSFVVTTNFHPLMRPPRVRVITFASCTCHIYIMGFGQYWTSFYRANSSTPIMPYVISVRQVEVLPPTSFRFHLAMDTLVFQLTVPTAKPVADLHRQVITHAGHTRMPQNIHVAADTQNYR
jgi:hypothetical protein